VKNTIKIFLFLSLFFCFAVECFSQYSTDSLLNTIPNLKGIEKVEAIMSLISVEGESDNDFLLSNPEISLKMLNEARVITEDEGLSRKSAQVHAQLSRYYGFSGDFPNELNHLFMWIESVKKDINYSEKERVTELADVYILIGNAYKDKGNLPDALKYYLKSKENYQQSENRIGEINVSGSIGLVYLKEEKYESAVEEFENAIAIADKLPKEERNVEELAVTYSNLGRTKAYQKDFAKANDYLNRALEIDRELGDQYGVAYDYFNLAEVMEMQNSNSSALRYIDDAYKIFESYGGEASMAACKIMEGKIFRKQKLYEKSQVSLASALKTAQELGMKPLMQEAYEQLFELYESQGNSEKAFSNYKEFIAVKDSITNSHISESIENLRNSFEVQQKAEQIEALEIEKAKEKRLKNLLFFVSIFGGIISLGFIISVLNRYKLKQKANEKLEEKNKLVASTNEKMTGSIRYGRRIQKALLASGDQLTNCFPESFIFLKPKDIVTGDFYWYADRGDEQIIAAIDCTGHGVPGAFMTVFGYSLLNKIVNNDKVTEPSEILEALGLEVMRLFQTKDEGQIIQDGMDMAVVKINHATKELQYAGANRPMVLHTKDGQQYIREDKVGLGGKTMIERGKSFNTFTHPYEQGDTFYIFSDGFQDQFGGPEERKFMSKRFRALLDEIQPLSMHAQEEKLNQVLRDWMGTEKQTDDIIVIGVRLED
jgi:tetratricopeptide (TPR) repeat protein